MMDGIAVVETIASGRNRCWISLEYLLRLCQRCTAMPDFHKSRIAGIRQASRSEIGTNEQCVPVNPGNIGLGFGKDEAVLYKTQRFHVELAGDHRVRATI